MKRVRLDRAESRLILASDNQAYPTVTVDLCGTPLHTLILGRIAWVSRYFLATDPSKRTGTQTGAMHEGSLSRMPEPAP